MASHKEDDAEKSKELLQEQVRDLVGFGPTDSTLFCRSHV